MARIPMRGRVASLNASVAGSVFLFEAAAQRWANPPSPPHRAADQGAEERSELARSADESSAERASATMTVVPEADAPATVLDAGAADAEATIDRATRPGRWPPDRRRGSVADLTRQGAEHPPLAARTIPALLFCVAADVAQLAEQWFCKPPVPGSSPVVGSNNRGRCVPSPQGLRSRGVHGRIMGRLSRW